MITVKNLHVTFNPSTPLETKALRGVSIKIPKGQFVTVIGSNGAGKSTFLNALSGDTKTTKGEISIDTLKVTKWPAEKRAQHVSRVFQDPMVGTCENLTIQENLALAYKRDSKRGLGRAIKANEREVFREKLSLLKLGLENRLNDPMGRLSGGQRQAVCLLMATLRPMKILLLDEHTAALDPKTAEFVLELTDKFVNEDKLTTLMVTHSMRQALDHGERTIMLHEGKVVLDVAGKDREKMDVPDLLDMFHKTQHQELSDDSLLLE